VLSTGEVSTIAGTTGITGSADGIGTAAQFNGPRALALDGEGNLYVADQLNSTIRKIVLATAEVSTLAGTAGSWGSADGIGAAAQFFLPIGLAADRQGNLYVADYLNYTVRKIVLASAQVSTLAGTPGAQGSANGVGSAAQFYGPQDLAADGTGNLYLTDVALIFFIDPQQGTETTFFTSTIRKIGLRSTQVSTLAGTPGIIGTADGVGPAAQFNSPSGLAVDGARHLYIADTGSGTVRKLDLATGYVSTVIGKANQRGVRLGTRHDRLNEPVSVTVLAPDHLVVLDGEENVVLEAR